MSSSLDFAHRHNHDDTWDSICRICYLTVATADTEEDLAAPEHNHDCDELWVVKKARIRGKPDVSEDPSRDWKYYPGERNQTHGFLNENNSRHG